MTMTFRKGLPPSPRTVLYLTSALVALACIFGTQCTRPTPVVPENLEQYGQMRATNPDTYPRTTIRMKNLQRVMNTQLPGRERVESLNLLVHLGAESPEMVERLSLVLSEPQCPDELRKAVLSFLVEQNYPGLAKYVVPSLAQADQDPALRDSILEWLMRNPSPEVLAEVVKLWADEPSPTSMNEPRYRNILERMAGKPWDEALLAGINTRASFPRGRALEILAARLPAREVKSRILQIHPETEAMAALQSFIETLDYIPATREDFASATTVFSKHLEMMSGVSRLASQWRTDYGYPFEIRDFHLLSRLATDPLRSMLKRTQLVLEISRALAARQHVQYKARPPQAGRVTSDLFDSQVQDLSIANLWNIYLLNEMLSRPRMQLALRIVADAVRADVQTARNGLVFYQHGQAEAMLYPLARSDQEAPAGPHPLSAQMIQDGRDSLCRFYTHFDQVRNTNKAGPDAEELSEAARDGCYGLILTGVDEYSFCAHYYNPAGRVVSLGKFPLPR